MKPVVMKLTKGPAKPVRLKVVPHDAWKKLARDRNKIARKAMKSGKLEGVPAVTMVSADHRYRVELTFAVPSRVHPMSFDRCFSSAIGRVFSDGAGTSFSAKKGKKFTAAGRDHCFLFAMRNKAEQARLLLADVLFSHRLKGKVEVYDDAWEPPRKLNV